MTPAARKLFPGVSFGLLYLALVITGACKHPPVAPSPPALAPAPGCLVSPPPRLEALQLLGPDAGCPPKLVGCLDVDGALALERDLRAMRLYVREAWIRCGEGYDGGSKLP